MEIVFALLVVFAILVGAYFIYFKKLFDDTNNCLKTESLYSVKKYDTNCYRVSPIELITMKKYLESDRFSFSMVEDRPCEYITICDIKIVPEKHRRISENSLKTKADIAIGKRFEENEKLNYVVRFDDGRIIISDNKMLNDAINRDFK